MSFHFFFVCFNCWITLLSLRRLSKILPSEVKRKFSAILYSKCSYPLSSATRNSLSPKSTYVDIGSTSVYTNNPLTSLFSSLRSIITIQRNKPIWVYKFILRILWDKPTNKKRHKQGTKIVFSFPGKRTENSVKSVGKPTCHLKVMKDEINGKLDGRLWWTEQAKDIKIKTN